MKRRGAHLACRSPRDARLQASLRAALAVGAIAFATAVVIVGLVLSAPAGPPGPSRTAAAPDPFPISAAVARPGVPPPASAAPPSLPMTLRIPALHVTTPIIPESLNPDGTPQVPPLTYSGVREVGWYDPGPVPGQVGSAVIVGHVDSRAAGEGVFFNLGRLVPGDEAAVTLADRKVVSFRVISVQQYPKRGFPVQLVYGPVSYPALRLITCGGAFDRATGRYLSNIVVYAKEI